MLSKHQTPQLPTKLRLIHFLSNRTTLSSLLKQQFHQLKQGYLGELFFHTYVKPYFSSEHVHLCSLSLQQKQSYYQLDRLLFFKERIFLFEIKHFFGDYIIRDKNWYALQTMKEINNPFI